MSEYKKGREVLNKLIDLEVNDKGITLSYGGELKEKEITKYFDEVRKNIANEIGLPKETLFPLIYGDEKMKEEYIDFVRKLVEKYEKRPKE